MTHSAPIIRRSALIAAAASLSLLAAGVAFADAPGKNGPAARQEREASAIRGAVERGEILPLPRILAVAQQHVAGEVLKIELEQEHGRLAYEVKILAANGRVREVKLDARSGALIEIEDD